MFRSLSGVLTLLPAFLSVLHASAAEPYAHPYVIESSVESHALLLEIDTGSIVSMLPATVVDRLQSKRFAGFLRMWTLNGERKATLYLVPYLQVGQCMLRDVIVYGSDTTGLKSSVGSDGLLGRQALAQLGTITLFGQQGLFSVTCR